MCVCVLEFATNFVFDALHPLPIDYKLSMCNEYFGHTLQDIGYM